MRPGGSRTSPFRPPFTHPQAKDPKSGKVYIVAQSRLPFIPGAVPKETKKAKDGKEG